jgi:hypothetical protein
MMVAGNSVAMSGAPATIEAAIDLADGGAITNDGAGTYVSGDECVNTWFDSRKGNLFFRTVSFNLCGDVPAVRKVRLDFSSFVGSLANCDDTAGGGCLIEGDGQFGGLWLDAKGANVLPDVRITADSLFTRSATPVNLAFDLGENYVQAGGQDVQFSLSFLGDLPVVNNGDASRTVGSNGSTIARLSRRNSRGKFVKVGDYVMPFSMTAGPK